MLIITFFLYRYVIVVIARPMIAGTIADRSAKSKLLFKQYTSKIVRISGGIYRSINRKSFGGLRLENNINGKALSKNTIAPMAKIAIKISFILSIISPKNHQSNNPKTN
jgi:hypothetical protein